MSSNPAPAAPTLGPGEALSRFGRWCAAQPLQAALLAGSLATFVWFFFFVHIWVNGEETTLKWAMKAWSHKSGEQYHGRFVPLVSIFLIWLRRARYLAAPKSPSNWGLLWLAVGVLSFVIGARCLQPRFALVAVPFLFYGATLFLWGRHVARLALFPCVFLIFMIPLASLEQATADLQFVITGAIGVMANLIGITVQAIGTTLTAKDGSFNFEIAEGCSGVRSLSAMSMLTAVYVHLTQDRLWKKIFIFGASLLFAIFGNVGRLFTILVFAKYISPEIAGGLYHDYSGFLFFPIAVLGMTGFSRLVNLDWKKISARWTRNDPVRPDDFIKEENKPSAKSSADPISYDY